MCFVSQPLRVHANISSVLYNFFSSIVCESGGCRYAQGTESTITKCMWTVVLAAAAQAGGDGGDQSQPRQVR